MTQLQLLEFLAGMGAGALPGCALGWVTAKPIVWFERRRA